MTNAKNTFGNTLWLAAAGGTLVKVAGSVTIEPPILSREMQDATTHDSVEGFQEVIPDGTIDPGNIKGEMDYVAGSPGDVSMLAALVGGLQVFKIVLKSATGTEDLEGSCYLMSYGPLAQPVKGIQRASFELKVTGKSTQVPSA